MENETIKMLEIIIVTNASLPIKKNHRNHINPIQKPKMQTSRGSMGSIDSGARETLIDSRESLCEI
jgi:hypothetical protein